MKKGNSLVGALFGAVAIAAVVFAIYMFIKTRIEDKKATENRIEIVDDTP